MVIKYVVYQKLIYVFRVRVSQEGKTATRTERRTDPFSFRGKLWRMSNALALSLSIYICSLLSFSVLWPLLCCTCSPFQCNKYHSFCRRRSVQMVQEPKGIFENAFFASCVQVCALRTSSLCHYYIYIEQLSTHLNYGQDVHDGHCMRYLLITSASQNWIYYCYLIYISMRLKWRPKT